MYVYQFGAINKGDKTLNTFTVGYYDPTGGFCPVETFYDEFKARKLVNYLNGGLGYQENDWLRVSTSNSDAI